ncbi:hypothetical protein J4E93_001631 [Alternaria ventricosa]|uniref:uncharacterized protein n=1 Tax=Alternaria ventricosa TaxID=1187951 RepID=UPI0020C4F44E|nr:uncharacterized protein J4E93_001631 [Alternaria ventricosa]KAI4653863.1 hypothetical protein J4E93_001631 [Alternaria ventricosa]
MSSQIPLRSIRIPALQRQCLFLRHQTLLRAAQPTITQPSSHRALSSTPSRPAKHRRLGHDKAQSIAAARSQISPSPSVNFEQAQTNTDAMAEDIGLLQNTIVRAPFLDVYKQSPGLAGVLRYYWEIVKHKATGLYSRYYYRDCIQKSGWTKYLPVEPFNNTQYKVLAKRYYQHIYRSFASGNITPLKQVCLPPLVKKLKQRIAARGQMTLEWNLHEFKSARVMSHRASPLGEQTPDTAYRQVVVRLVSVQSVERSTPTLPKFSKSSIRAAARLPWVPDAARQRAEKARQQRQKSEHVGEMEKPVAKSDEPFIDNGVKKTVVEYLVLQKRVIKGTEEDWKVWGFTEASTPSVLAREELYWSQMLNVQAGGAV